MFYYIMRTPESQERTFIMIGKKTTKLLISPEEIVEICDKAGTIDSIDIARAVEKAYLALNSVTSDKDCWLYYCLIATIYDAGRIQGIREERAHRKGAKS